MKELDKPNLRAILVSVATGTSSLIALVANIYQLSDSPLTRDILYAILIGSAGWLVYLLIFRVAISYLRIKSTLGTLRFILSDFKDRNQGKDITGTINIDWIADSIAAKKANALGIKVKQIKRVRNGKAVLEIDKGLNVGITSNLKFIVTYDERLANNIVLGEGYCPDPGQTRAELLVTLRNQDEHGIDMGTNKERIRVSAVEQKHPDEINKLISGLQFEFFKLESKID